MPDGYRKCNSKGVASPFRIVSILTSVQLFEELPEVDLDDLENGEYHLNLHFVTGRKPKDPRPGDLLADGTRQEMTNLKYDTMARYNNKRNSQWQRRVFS